MTTAREAVLAALTACTVPITADFLAGRLDLTAHAVQLELIQLANAGLLVRGRRSGGPAKFGKVPRWTHRDTYLYATKANVDLWKSEATA